MGCSIVNYNIVGLGGGVVWHVDKRIMLSLSVMSLFLIYRHAHPHDHDHTQKHKH